MVPVSALPPSLSLHLAHRTGLEPVKPERLEENEKECSRIVREKSFLFNMNCCAAMASSGVTWFEAPLHSPVDLEITLALQPKMSSTQKYNPQQVNVRERERERERERGCKRKSLNQPQWTNYERELPKNSQTTIFFLHVVVVVVIRQKKPAFKSNERESAKEKGE